MTKERPHLLLIRNPKRSIRTLTCAAGAAVAAVAGVCEPVRPHRGRLQVRGFLVIQPGRAGQSRNRPDGPVSAFAEPTICTIKTDGRASNIAERRPTARAVSPRARPRSVRGVDRPAWADGPGRVPPRAPLPARRRRRVPGHLPPARPKGAVDPQEALGGKLALRHGLPGCGPSTEDRRAATEQGAGHGELDECRPPRRSAGRPTVARRLARAATGP